jgi:hypothetical protein
MKWRQVAAVLLLALSGAAMLPMQGRLAQEAQAAHFQKISLDIDLRERIGQAGFLAALSGFRSPLAAILWIEAHAAWENTEWGRMAGLFDTVTTLQPRSLTYWDMASWHMAWNASIAAMQNEKQPSEALRIKAQREYFNLGRDFLERGIKNNPDRYQLYLQLAVLLRDKFEDHCAAAEAFAKAASFPDAPTYAARFACYELAKCPGREREAYEKLRALWLQGEKQRLPSLINFLRELENRLDIPTAARIDSAPAHPQN